MNSYLWIAVTAGLEHQENASQYDPQSMLAQALQLHDDDPDKLHCLMFASHLFVSRQAPSDDKMDLDKVISALDYVTSHMPDEHQGQSSMLRLFGSLLILRSHDRSSSTD